MLVEIPAIRQCANRRFQVDESNGRIDYWCIYQNYTFVIEMKHGYDTYKQDDDNHRSLRQSVYKEWHTMNSQLISLIDEVKGYQEKTKGVIRLGLHFITSRKRQKPSKELINIFRNPKNIRNTAERFSNIGQNYKLSYPDLALCWKIPRWMIESDEEESYPGLWVIAKIMDPETHEGANS